MAATANSLSALLAQASLDDHDEILKAANAALKKSKTDLDALHAKVVALLKLDRYDDAVKVLEDTPKLQERARLEYAYALYKTGNAAKAVEVAAVDDSSRAMKHILGQAVCYVDSGQEEPGLICGRHIDRRTLNKRPRCTNS
jgi:signal recognition particle subunit SRP72